MKEVTITFSIKRNFSQNEMNLFSALVINLLQGAHAKIKLKDICVKWSEENGSIGSQ